MLNIMTIDEVKAKARISQIDETPICPSCKINSSLKFKDDKYFYCDRCELAGNAISYYSLTREVDFLETIYALAKIFKIKLIKDKSIGAYFAAQMNEN